MNIIMCYSTLYDIWDKLVLWGVYVMLFHFQLLIGRFAYNNV